MYIYYAIHFPHIRISPFMYSTYIYVYMSGVTHSGYMGHLFTEIICVLQMRQSPKILFVVSCCRTAVHYTLCYVRMSECVWLG